LWPSLMLQTMDHKTLTVGLAALQGMFSSDFRGTAAGVTITVIPILIFFVTLQKYFVRGLTGAVKG
jgi:putative chitobiose transport system permease protein